ncbi:MAG: extracellular solute-binding protein [Candidatus Paceibacterota bacterium]|jgi:multiple sugar transport system substrate-binding protein
MDNLSNFEKILLVVFGFLAALGLLAFSTYKTNNSGGSDIEVVVWGNLDKMSFDNFISTVMDEQNKKLNIKYVQKNYDTLDNDLLESIASGVAPDTVILSNEFIKKYSDKIYPISYETLPERTFKDTYIQEAELLLRQDGIFGVPFFVDPLIMYWNRDMFASAGIANPPEKWSEFPLLASKLSKTDSNANIIKSFVSFGEYRNVNNIKGLLSSLIIQTGNPIVNYKDGKFKSYLLSESSNSNFGDVSSAISFFTEYSNPKKSVYSWNRSLPFSKQSFLSEDLSIYFGMSSEYNSIKQKNPNLNFDISLLPQVVDTKAKSTFGDFYSFIFLKNSKNLLNTYNVVSYITGSESIKVFLKNFDLAPARKDIISLGTNDPVKNIFYKSALISKGWIDPDTKKTDQIFQNMIEDITTGKLQVSDSVKKAGTEMNYLLQ